MKPLSDGEVRRLLRYLHAQIDDADVLAQLEEELCGEEADEFLSLPTILGYFPRLRETITIANQKWLLQVFPHAHLRMVQRGVKLHTVLSVFQRFVEYCAEQGETILQEAYSIYDPSLSLTLRIDIDLVKDDGGESHLGTVFFGHGETSHSLEVILM